METDAERRLTSANSVILWKTISKYRMKLCRRNLFYEYNVKFKNLVFHVSGKFFRYHNASNRHPDFLSLSLSLFLSLFLCLSFLYTRIYIYNEREREKEREGEWEREREWKWENEYR